jgi:hypothetical protein
MVNHMTDKIRLELDHKNELEQSCSDKFADEMAAQNHSIVHKAHCAPHKTAARVSDKPFFDLGQAESLTVEPFVGYGWGDGSTEPAKIGLGGLIEKAEPTGLKVDEERFRHEAESEWQLGLKINY